MNRGTVLGQHLALLFVAVRLSQQTWHMTCCAPFLFQTHLQLWPRRHDNPTIVVPRVNGLHSHRPLHHQQGQAALCDPPPPQTHTAQTAIIRAPDRRVLLGGLAPRNCIQVNVSIYFRVWRPSAARYVTFAPRYVSRHVLELPC